MSLRNLQPNPNKRQHAPTAIGQMLNRYAISLADIQKCMLKEGCKFTSRASIHRIVRGEVSQQMKEAMYPQLITCLTKFLIARGLDATEIDDAMTKAFEEGEYQPMISQRLELSPQAIKFFGLKKDPFTDPPGTREEVFISPEFRQVIDRVVDAVRFQGFVAVIGPIGSGKSTLRALIEDQVAGEPNLRIVWPEFFDMKNVSPMQIAEAILTEFDAPVPGTAYKRGVAVKSLLARLYKNGVKVALGVDEIHRANDRFISSLKNFLEMNSGGFQRYLGVVLFGQPIFLARLREPMFQEIYERIVPVEMPNFKNAAAEYLRHRLEKIGADIDDLFDQDAIDLIASQATTPLSAGNIANQALKISMEVFENKKVIGAAIKTKMFFENRPQGFKLRQAS